MAAQHQGQVNVIRAVLFDAAGTLIYVREPVGKTYARLAREYGVDASPDEIGQAFRTLFRAMPPMVSPRASPSRSQELERQWWRELVYRVFQSIHMEHCFGDFDAYFERLFDHFAEPTAWTLADGAIPTLRALRARGIRTGIVSNFDHRLPGILDGLGLTPLLDVVVCPADVGAAKPDPRIFAAALARLAVAPNQALYVGDNEEGDIAGARRAGLHGMLITALPGLPALLTRLGSGPQGNNPPA